MRTSRHSPTRRRTLALIAASAAALAGCSRVPAPATRSGMLTLHTFGDSILDCARYNAHGVHPGQLLVRNDDGLFPEFRGRDLASQRPARLVHRAVDGATVDGLAPQAAGVEPDDGVALVTIGGNDLLRGLAADRSAGVRGFARALHRFCERLPLRPILLGTVYDPTFGNDTLNFLGVDARIARANHRRVNEVIADLADRYGALADLHAHFLTGRPDWYTNTIEPSLIGASEVRRVFWSVLQDSGLAAEPPARA